MEVVLTIILNLSGAHKFRMIHSPTTSSSKVSESVDSVNGMARQIVGAQQVEGAGVKANNVAEKYMTLEMKTIEGLEVRHFTCKWCKKTYNCGSATSAAVRHLKEKHNKFLDKSDQLETKVSTKTGPITKFLGKGELLPKYSPENFRKQLVKAVAVHSLPYNFVEYDEVRKLFQMLLPDVQLIGRSTLALDVEETFNTMKAMLITEIDQATSKISLTLDMWTSRSKLLFMGATLHYINQNWKLINTVLALEYTPGRHSGKLLAERLFAILSERGVVEKIGWITVDNAANNDTMMSELKRHFAEIGYIFDPKFQHIRCTAHVVNLVAQAFMKNYQSKKRTIVGMEESINDEVVEVSVEKSDDEFELDELDKQLMNDLNEVLVEDEPDLLNLKLVYFNDSLSRAKAAVLKIHGNNVQNYEKFKRVCVGLHKTPRSPVIDVCTRWNSTHDMVQFFIDYSEVFELWCRQENCQDLILSQTDVDHLVELRDALCVLKDATKRSSGENLPTSEQVLIIFSVMLKHFGSLSNDVSKSNQLRNATQSAFEKASKYFTKMSPALLVATILHPKKKLGFIHQKCWNGSNLRTQAEKVIKEQLDLYKTKYHFNYAIESQKTTPQKSNSLFAEFDDITVDGISSTELERYLDSPASDLDRLVYWSSYESKYPILARMAADFLAIPASSVPCERVFNRSGGIVTPDRNRLSEKSVEKLLCLKFWFNRK